MKRKRWINSSTNCVFPHCVGPTTMQVNGYFNRGSNSTYRSIVIERNMKKFERALSLLSVYSNDEAGEIVYSIVHELSSWIQFINSVHKLSSCIQNFTNSVYELGSWTHIMYSIIHGLSSWTRFMNTYQVFDSSWTQLMNSVHELVFDSSWTR